MKSVQCRVVSRGTDRQDEADDHIPQFFEPRITALELEVEDVKICANSTPKLSRHDNLFIVNLQYISVDTTIYYIY